MAVLRIADYLQLGKRRVPNQLPSVQALRRPISEQEFKTNNSLSIRCDRNDPEAQTVTARPDDVRTYLQIEELLAGLQRELDTSWSVIGEVYGSSEDHENLHLTLRRVRSNLDDRAQFEQTVKPRYVPVHACFRTATADLLPKLIRPLYEDEPAYGIRELVQNGVDAVRELREYVHSRGLRMKDLDLPEQEADVVVTLGDENGEPNWVVVQDRGIGMTEDVILNYFLTVGASFRDSDAWKKDFMHPDGMSRVLRSGRFGVGALAAFLLGDRVEVSTRHVGEKRGLRFTARIEDDPIAIEYVDPDEQPIGTTIRVPISENVREELFATSDRSRMRVFEASDDLQAARHDDADPSGPTWDWYCLSAPEPSVVRCGMPGPVRYKQALKLPPGDP